MFFGRVVFVTAVGLSLGGIAASWAFAQDERAIRELDGVTVVEKLNEPLDLTLTFSDHNGNSVKLGDFLKDDRPLLLTLNYYRCKMLCNLQLNALTKGLKGLDWTPGENFRLVTVSIDPRETPDLAHSKRSSYLSELARGEDVDWSFLVGSDENIRNLADSVGFGFRYDPEQDQYAHVPAIFFISPEGRVARYLYGLEYLPRDVKFALVEASEGRVGSAIDKILLSCFHYDETIGAYGPFAFGIMRVGAALAVVVLGSTLIVFWKRERTQMRTKEAT
ncbi:MAG: SCO family protein [Myxococcales bacterium]|nr:SCO family protein [Myxococcales bacterium]